MLLFGQCGSRSTAWALLGPRQRDGLKRDGYRRHNPGIDDELHLPCFVIEGRLDVVKTGASVLKILRNASAPVSLVNQRARKGYSHDDIAWQHRYVDIVTVTADGRLFIDYARFHDVTPDGVSANVRDGGDGRADVACDAEARILPPQPTSNLLIAWLFVLFRLRRFKVAEYLIEHGKIDGVAVERLFPV